MRIPIRLIRGTWPAWLERRAARLLWRDPRLVADDHSTPEEFSAAMAAFRVGDTFKITGADRHAIADSLLMDNVDVANAMILDIGASDGSTAVDLIAKLPQLRSYVIADISLHMAMATIGRYALFYDQEGRCVLVAGRRLLAWPTLSRPVRLLCTPLIRRAARQPERRRTLLMLNPSARSLIASDSRVTFQTHDVFTPWTTPTPDVIKVANLLRRLYFNDEMLLRALSAILGSLPEGGHFLLVDNPRAKGVGPRAGIYRRSGGRFQPVARTPTPPEIDELVCQIGVDSGAGEPASETSATRTRSS